MIATIPEGSSQGSTPGIPPGRFPQGFPQGDPPPQGSLQGFAQRSTPGVPRRNLPPGIPPGGFPPRDPPRGIPPNDLPQISIRGIPTTQWGGRNHARSCAILFAVLIRSRPIPRAHSVCLPSGWASMSATIPEGSSQGSTPGTPQGDFPRDSPKEIPLPRDPSRDSPRDQPQTSPAGIFPQGSPPGKNKGQTSIAIISSHLSFPSAMRRQQG